MPQPDNPGAQGRQRATEAQKKAGPREEVLKAKIRTTDGTLKEVDIISKTKPNANGGYDTEVHVPVGHVGVRRINPGGQPIGG